MATGGDGAMHGGRRSALPRGQRRVASGGEAKRTSRCPLRPSWAQMVVGAPWTRSTGGGNREGDGGRDLVVISEISGTSR